MAPTELKKNITKEKRETREQNKTNNTEKKKGTAFRYTLVFINEHNPILFYLVSKYFKFPPQLKEEGTAFVEPFVIPAVLAVIPAQAGIHSSEPSTPFHKENHTLKGVVTVFFSVVTVFCKLVPEYFLMNNKCASQTCRHSIKLGMISAVWK